MIGVRSGTEEPAFRLVERRGDIEIRAYGARLAAETTVAAADEMQARSEGFRRLARFIFGANQPAAILPMTAPVAQAGERIAMTAPVAAAGGGPDSWRIRFYMPAAYTPERLPRPNDPAVAIVTLTPEMVAVLRYAGVPTAAEAARQRATLLAGLAETGWQPVGAPFDWFYDPPWTLPGLRRNEAAVAVRRAAGGDSP